MTSFITQSLSESGILYRITPPDIAGALGLFFFVLSGRSFNFSYNQPMILFIITLFIGGLVGLNLSQSIIEVVILLFTSYFLSSGRFIRICKWFCELIYYFSLAGI